MTNARKNHFSFESSYLEDWSLIYDVKKCLLLKDIFHFFIYASQNEKRLKNEITNVSFEI